MAESPFLLRMGLCVCLLSNRNFNNLHFSLHCLRLLKIMLQALHWLLLLTTLPPQKDCRDVSLQGLMSSFTGQHQHQIWVKCAKIWGRLAWEASKRTFIALLLSSQALKPLYVHNNSQVVNYTFVWYTGINIWQSWSLIRAQRKQN